MLAPARRLQVTRSKWGMATIGAGEVGNLQKSVSSERVMIDLASVVTLRT